MAHVRRILPKNSESRVDAARKIVLEHGWNATAFQIVNPGFDLWFNRAGDAVAGSMASHGVRVVAGGPICRPETLPGTVQEFEKATLERGERLCYFGAADRVFNLLSSQRGYSSVVMGAQPVWSPREWRIRTQADRSLRAQFHRAANKSVCIEEWSADRATDNHELRRLLQEWLTTRGLPPLHFLIEPETLSRLDGRRVFVAVRDGRPVGFTVLSPVPVRKGWLTEQFVRGWDAPNGTVELMIDGAIQAVAHEGAEYLTMGLVPLSGRDEGPVSTDPFWLRKLLAWIRGHGRRYYNFEGLEHFKSKFHPAEWEQIYVVSKEAQFSMRSLWAIASVFAGGSPTVAVLRGALKRRRRT